MTDDTPRSGLPDTSAGAPAGAGGGAQPGRYPAIARACFHLAWMFLLFWVIYVLGPDALGIIGVRRDGSAYAVLSGSFFLMHFVIVSVAIIALFVVIIEVHAGRPVRGFRSVLVALGLPIVSFLYFAARFLAQVERWLGRN